jgi:GT2 family glycosyltransferase
MYSEDVDLCRRAHGAGHRVAVIGGATLMHAHGGASRKDSPTAALTRSEVVISRHFYASRHFGALHAALYHAALVVTRFVPKAFTRTGRMLARHYREVPSRGWRSARARPLSE